MCTSCLWEDYCAEIERRLVNSLYASHAAELMQLVAGVKERGHVGDAAYYRLKAIDAQVKEENGVSV